MRFHHRKTEIRRCSCELGYISKHPDDRRSVEDSEVPAPAKPKAAPEKSGNGHAAAAPAPAGPPEAAKPVPEAPDTRVFTRLLRNPREDEREQAEKAAEKARLRSQQVGFLIFLFAHISLISSIEILMLASISCCSHADQGGGEAAACPHPGGGAPEGRACRGPPRPAAVGRRGQRPLACAGPDGARGRGGVSEPVRRHGARWCCDGSWCQPGALGRWAGHGRVGP